MSADRNKDDNDEVWFFFVMMESNISSCTD
jgi:hypothetical protein